MNVADTYYVYNRTVVAPLQAAKCLVMLLLWSCGDNEKQVLDQRESRNRDSSISRI